MRCSRLRRKTRRTTSLRQSTRPVYVPRSMAMNVRDSVACARRAAGRWRSMRYAHWTSTPSSMALSGYEVGQTIMARGELHYAALSDGLDERVRTLQAALAVRASSYEPPTSHRLWHTTSSPTAAVT